MSKPHRKLVLALVALLIAVALRFCAETSRTPCDQSKREKSWVYDLACKGWGNTLPPLKY